jgi:hypothetical protein
VAGLQKGQGENLNHIIAFAKLQEGLVTRLNESLTTSNSQKWNKELENFVLSLFPYTNEPIDNNDRVVMRQRVIGLGNAVNEGNRLEVGERANEVLKGMNSSFHNVRVGNESINKSIGDDIDADFAPGELIADKIFVSENWHDFYDFSGPYRRLTNTSNRTVFAYWQASRQPLSFTINGGQGARHRLRNEGVQLSSVTNLPSYGQPSAVIPVIVFEPNGPRGIIFR